MSKKRVSKIKSYAVVGVITFLLPLFSFLVITSCSSDDGYQSRLRELLLEDMTFGCEQGEQEQTFRHEDLSAFTVKSNQSWCVPRLDINNSKLIVTVMANDTYDARIDTVTFTDSNNQATRFITVTQARRTGLILDKIGFEAKMAGDTITAKLKSNVSYTVQIPDTIDWVTQPISSSKARGLEESSITFYVNKNKTYHDRDAVITVTNKDEKLTDKLTIHQPFNQVFKVDSTAFEASMDGQEIIANVESNIPFTVTIPDSSKWVTIPKRLIKNDEFTTTDTELKFTVKENTTYHARDAVIILSNEQGGISDTISIHQPFTAVFKADKKSFEAPMDGGTITINMESNVSYDVKIPAGCDWISRAASRSGTRGTTTSVVELKVAANKSYKAREAVVIIGNQAAGVSESITITQPFNTTFSVDKNDFEVEQGGGTFTVNLTHNISYDVEIPDDCDWITLPTSTRGKSQTSKLKPQTSNLKSRTRAEPEATAITFRVKANESYKARDAVVTIGNKAAGVSIKISVHQPFSTVFSVDKNTHDVDQDGGTVIVTLTHNIGFDVKIPDDCDWITLPASTRAGAESQTTVLTFRVKENTTYEARDAIITISNKEAGAEIKVSIHQAFTTTFKADKTSFDVPTEGGTITVNMESNVGYDVSIPSDCDWITLPVSTRGKSQTSNLKPQTSNLKSQTRAAKTTAVVLRVSENTTYKERDAVVTISNKEAGVSVGIYIHQPFETVFNVDKAEAEVPMDGGTVTATVESNVDYNVSIPSDCKWITLTTSTRGKSQTSNLKSQISNLKSQTRAAKTSVLVFRVAPNTSGRPRAATVTIGNTSAGVRKGLTITQPFESSFKVDEAGFELDERSSVIGVNVSANVSVSVQSQDDWLTVGNKTNVTPNSWTQQIIVSAFSDKAEQRIGHVKFIYPEAADTPKIIEVVQKRTLYIRESAVTIKAGEKYDLSQKLTNSKARTLTWSSSNTKIATVNSSGTVTAVAAGKAVITVKSVDGKFSDTVNVTVEAASTKKTSR